MKLYEVDCITEIIVSVKYLHHDTYKLRPYFRLAHRVYRLKTKTIPFGVSYYTKKIQIQSVPCTGMFILPNVSFVVFASIVPNVSIARIPVKSYK